MNKTTGGRLKFALKKSNYTVAELARLLNVKHQVIQYLTSSDAKSSRYFLPISKILRINQEWLITGHGEIEEKNSDSTLNEATIPLYESESITIVKNRISFKETQIKSFLHSNFETKSEKIFFGWCIQDQSMHPRFPVKTTFIIQEGAKAKSGDFVLAYVKQTNEIYFRLFLENKGVIELIPFNTRAYNHIQLMNEDKLIGVMIEARLNC